MALDKYQRSQTLLPVGELTNVASQQALRSSQTLEGRLDKLSSYFYEELKQDAITQGELYAVKNAPTLAQITDAIANDQDVNAYFAEGGSYYGNAARKVQSDLLRQDSIAMYLNTAERIKIGLDNKAISLDEVDNLVNTLQAEMDGTYDVLASINPDAALKYNAQASTIGHDVFNKANEVASKAAYELKVEGIKQFETDYTSALEDKLKTTNDPYQAFYVLKHIRNDVVASYGMLSDGPKREILLENKENTVLQDWIASKIAQDGTVVDWMKGEIKDYDAILEIRGMQGNKDEIAKLALTKEKEFTDAVENQQKQLKLVNNQKADEEELKFFNGTSPYSPSEFIEKQAKNGRYYTVAQKEKIFEVPQKIEPTTEQTTNFNRLKQQLELDFIGKTTLDIDLKNNKITSKQYATLIADYIKTTDNYSAGKEEIKLQLGIMEGEMPSAEKDQKLARYSAVLQKFNAEMRRRQEEGLPLNQIEYAQEIAKEGRILLLGERLSNAEQIVIGQLNYHEIPNKLEDLAKMSEVERKKLYQKYNLKQTAVLENTIKEIQNLTKELQEITKGAK